MSEALGRFPSLIACSPKSKPPPRRSHERTNLPRRPGICLTLPILRLKFQHGRGREFLPSNTTDLLPRWCASASRPRLPPVAGDF